MDDKAKKSVNLDKERYQKKNQNSEASKHNDHESKGFVSDSLNESTREKCACHICGQLGTMFCVWMGTGNHVSNM